LCTCPAFAYGSTLAYPRLVRYDGKIAAAMTSARSVATKLPGFCVLLPTAWKMDFLA
jgi:hypothetical protein